MELKLNTQERPVREKEFGKKKLTRPPRDTGIMHFATPLFTASINLTNLLWFFLYINYLLTSHFKRILVEMYLLGRAKNLINSAMVLILFWKIQYIYNVEPEVQLN